MFSCPVHFLSTTTVGIAANRDKHSRNQTPTNDYASFAKLAYFQGLTGMFGTTANSGECCQNGTLAESEGFEPSIGV